MTENNLHNLMTQMTQEQKSLWRIEKHYVDETEGDEEKSFWQGMIADKKKHITDLQNLIKEII